MTDLPTFEPEEEPEGDLDDGRAEAVLRAAAETSGIPWEPFTEVQKREAEASAEAMSNIATIEICGVIDSQGTYNKMDAYDTCDLVNPDTGKPIPQGNLIVQMLAASRWKRYLDECDEDKSQLIDARHAPSHDESDTLTLTRLYVLTDHSRYLAPLELPYNWDTYIHKTLGHITKCDAHVLHRCYSNQIAPASNTLVYKRGEFIYAFKICAECLEAMSWIGFDHPDYAGPLHKWHDDGERGDPWGDINTSDVEWDF